MFFTETTNIAATKKLDYSLKTAEERQEFVANIVAQMTKEQLKNKKYLEILSDYIVSAMTPEEKKSKMILTDNRMVTVNKRETSYEEYTCPIFVTYKKDDDISETTKYEDVFMDNTLFSWMSRSRRTSESEEVATIINQPRNNIRVMLFIKKDDAEGTDFYYLGKMNYNSYLDTTMKSGESVVNIQFDMETPVPQNLYNYFEG